MNLIDNLRKFYSELVISPAIKKEVIDQGKIKGYSDALIAEQNLERGIIKIHTPKSLLTNLNLGMGEIEILSLAIEENSPCLIDDINAQMIGIKLNIDLKSIPLILLELLKKGSITIPDYDNFLEKYGKIVHISHIEFWFYKKLGEVVK